MGDLKDMGNWKWRINDFAGPAEREVARRLRAAGVKLLPSSKSDDIEPYQIESLGDGGFDLYLHHIDEQWDVKRKTEINFTGHEDAPAQIWLGLVSVIDAQIDFAQVRNGGYIWMSHDLVAGLVIEAKTRKEDWFVKIGTTGDYKDNPCYKVSRWAMMDLDLWVAYCRQKQDERARMFAELKR